jgi:hypothetical protein
MPLPGKLLAVILTDRSFFQTFYQAFCMIKNFLPNILSSIFRDKKFSSGRIPDIQQVVRL